MFLRGIGYLAATRHIGSFGTVFHTRSLTPEEAIRERVHRRRNVVHFALVGRFAVASFLAGVRTTLGTFAQRLRRIAVQAAILVVCIVFGYAIVGIVGIVGAVGIVGIVGIVGSSGLVGGFFVL